MGIRRSRKLRGIFGAVLCVVALATVGVVVAAAKSTTHATRGSRSGAVRVSANSALARGLARGASLPAETVQLDGITPHLKRGRLRKPSHAARSKTKSGRAAAVRAAATPAANAAAKLAAAKLTAAGTVKPDLTKFSSSAVEGIKFSGLEDNDVDSDPLNVGEDLSADTEGVAGPKDYVETVGFAFGVFDKATGALIASEDFHDFFDRSGLGAPCEKATDKGYLEPHILYDPQSDRYIIMAASEQNAEEALTAKVMCIGVSKTGDPVAGGWYYYAVPLFTGGAEEISHSAVGMWTNGIYLQEEIYCAVNIKGKCPGNNELEEFDGTQVWAFNRSEMEAGAPLEVVTTQGNVKEKDNFKGSTKAEKASTAELEKCRVEITFCNEDAESPTPANIEPGLTLPPDSSEASKRNEYFLTPSDLPGEFTPKSDGLLDVWQWHVNWTEPSEDWIGKSKTEQYDYQVVTPTFFTPNDGVEYEVPAKQYEGSKYAIATAGGHYANPLGSEFDYIKPKPEYTDFNGKESLWAGYATSLTEKEVTVEKTKEAIVTPDRVRWEQISIESATGAPKVAGPKQTQDYAPEPTKLSRWLPSIGVDKEGDMALGYSGTDPEVFPSLYIAGQEKVEEVAEGKAKIESLPETVVDEGHGYQTGDYLEELENDFFGPQNTMSLDPNGCEFWFAGQTDVGSPTNEEGEDDAWATQVTAFRFKGCTPSALATELSATGEGNKSTGTASLTATLTATGTKSGLYGETVVFSLGGKTVGTAVTNDNGVATLSGVDSSTYAAGVSTGAVSASYAGASAYSYAGSSASGNLLVGGTQSISFAPLAGKTYGEAPFTVSASASSAEAVTFTAAGTCTVSGNEVTITGAGICTITAKQAGNGSTVLAASPVSQEFDIAKESQKITATGAWTAGQTAGKDFTASATSSVTLPCTAENNSGCIYFHTLETEKNCGEVESGETPRVTFLAKQTKEYDEAQKPALALCTVYAESAGNQNVASVLEPITVEITNKGTQTGKFSESLTSIPPLGEEKSEKVKVKTKFTLPELAAGVEDPVTWTPSELGTTSAVVTGTTSQGAIAAASTVAIGTEAATGTVEKITDSTKEEAATCKTPTVGTATVTMKESKSASDGLSAGEIITIEKATKAGYNATSVEIKTTPTINTFTYCIAKAAETEEKTGPTVKVLATIVVSGTTATAHVTAAPATAFAAKEKVNIAGVKGGEAEYNDKTVEILSAPTTTSFTFAVKSGTANGLNGTVGLPGTGAAENGGVATINLATEPASALSAGQEIEIGSVTVTTYNGTFKIKEVLSAKSFTYEDAAAKEAVASGAGELTSAVAPCKYSVPGYILKAENAGKCKIEAKQAGNESYGPGSATLELTISGGAQTIAWSPEGGNISSKTPTEITATTNSGISPGKITSTTEATCTVGASTEPVAGTAKVTVTPVAEGKCTLSASGNGGTPNWAELKATTKEFTVSNAGVTQTISFTEPTPATLVHSPVTLVATASSKLAVSFTSTTPSVCTTGGAHGEEVTLVAEGFCKITAEQAGQEGVYAAAKAVTEEFRVAKADQVLIFDSSDFSSVAYGTADFAIKGTSKAAASENAYNSEEQAEGEPTGLQPTYEAVGACTVNSEGTDVHITGTGVCAITASQAGNSLYREAPQVGIEFEVTKAASTITFANPGKQTANEPAFSPGATASSGAPVSYTAEGHCSITGAEEVKVTTAGTCTVTAHSVGTENYSPPARVSQSFEVVASTFTIEKLQKLAGEPTYSKSKITGAEIGAIVDYEVIVKNTNAGNVPLEFQPLSDAGCVSISPSGAETVAAGGQQAYTCEHMLTAAGSYANTASIEGNEGTGVETSNTVEAEVPTKASFTIEGEQKLEGEASYTKLKITGAEIGETVDYKILVKDTGNVPLTFKALSDGHCTGIAPAGEETVARGGEETYTCSHVLTATGAYRNTPSITGNEGTGTKSATPVEVEVPANPKFTIEAEQKLEGEASYTKSKITGGEVGKTVDYKIVVKNTGNVSLKFKALSDTGCTGVAPTGEETLARGGEETYTCSHELTATGVYTNSASIEGNEGTGNKTSNTVEAEVASAPSFTIEKEQKLEGEAAYTKSKLSGAEVGATVDYRIVVKNTGNEILTFKALSDPTCTGIAPAGEETVARGGEETYACSHELTAAGVYTNSASIEGNFGTGTKTSNTVEAEVPTKASFTIEKLQKLEGEASYTKSKLTGAEVGQTVDYQIVVKDSGNVPLTFKALSDSGCAGIAPAGEETVARGGEETYTCSHELTSAGVYANSASIEGNESAGTKTSNSVEAEVPSAPSFTIEKQQKLESEPTYTKSKLTGAIGNTVDYKIVVKNTGNISLTFKALSDAKCTGIAPAGEETVARGGEESYTCSHELTSTGVYTNSASIEGDESAGSKTSNLVEAEVPAKPGFTIEKEQKLAGEAGYTKSKLANAEIGETVDYKILVKNTGNTPLRFKALSDPKCTGIAPAGEESVARGGEETYTCSHELTGVGVYTNSASIEDKTASKTSNTVEAEVPPAPSFTVEKLQKVGAGSYTASELTGAIGDTVDYEVIVKNTGNTTLTFGALKDAGCEGVAGGATELASGASTTFTCSHKLTAAGPYSNQASIEGNEGTGTEDSNTVTANVPSEPSFTVEKLQKVGADSYTKFELTGAIGQTVDYEVIVKNTGNTTLTFGALKDAGCEGVAGGATELASGASTTFTCSHKLTAAGPYSNQASIEGNEGTGTEDSNTVTANVPSEPSFTVEKLQKIGAGSYTTSEVTGAIGDTVDYEVIVKNTGNTTLTFGALSDGGCEGVTGGASELASGEAATFTCSHKLTGTGKYSNAASITGNEGTGSETSNTVVANVPSEPAFTIEKEQKLSGEGTYTKFELTGAIGQTVDYEVIVKNTGNTTLTFGALSDGGCEGVTGGASELASGEAATFTCSHKLTGTGKYSNAASITGNEGTGSETSNTVITNVASEPAFTIAAQQKISGEASYTTSELTAKVGQTVDYEVVVQNTGNTTLKFGALSDGGCEGTSGGASELASGASATFTCSHALTGAGKYSNAASITGNEGTGAETSNTVTVSVAAAEASPHWYGDGNALAEGRSASVKLHGSITLHADGSAIMCKLAGVETIENPVGGGAGTGKVTSLNLTGCKATPTVCAVKEAVAVKASLPLSGELADAAPIRDELEGVELKVYCGASEVRDTLTGTLAPEVGSSDLVFASGSGELAESVGSHKATVTGRVTLTGPKKTKKITAKAP